MRRKVSTSRFADALAALRKHIKTCERCKLVSKSIIFDSMCNEGIALTHKVANLSMRLETLHRKAYADPKGFIYACPDRAKHGVDYARTAEPHINVAIQGELF
ncbi:MAG TPA: hypothetical protein VFV92_14030 [Candidatus Bathyarchaeia archaeon]|nr:hypothetical protein [Candidatus Bathyarchaeia archaeon]